MYTKWIYSPRTVISWSRRELLLFTLIAFVPVVLHEVVGLRWLHLPWLPIALVGTAVAFLLGFQNNATYGRIWEARKIWGGIVNASRKWGLQLCDFVTNEFADEPASEEELASLRRRAVMRHVAWLTTLRHALRQGRPWERSLEHPTNREWSEWIEVREHRVALEDELVGYLEPEELAEVTSLANPSFHVLRLQSAALRELRDRSLIDDFRHMEMQGVIQELLDCQGKSERIKNFPYPRQYATLHVLYVWIFVLLIPFGLVYEFDSIRGDLSSDFPRIAAWFPWLSIPFSVVVMWIFHTIERIGRTGENPFEGSPNDVPITTIARGIEIDLRQMLGEPESALPEPIEARCHTQS